jgi:hypothetical protein
VKGVDDAAGWVEKAIQLRFVVCRPLRAVARWPKIARVVNLPG